MRTFNSFKDLPTFTSKGYDVALIPNPIWNYIQELYSLLKLKSPTKEEGMVSNLYTLDAIPYLRGFILDQLKPLHEEWCGEELISNNAYGVRSYSKGADLFIHRDHIETHHISSIINLEWDVNWPLEIEGHNSKVVSITTKPQEMILYESAKCRHARTTPFKGNYFNNFYLHYRLKNWEYAGK